MSHPSLSSLSLLPRGVYPAGFLSARGEPMLIAVNQKHVAVVGPVAVPDTVPLEDVESKLWALLDLIDPQPIATAA